MEYANTGTHWYVIQHLTQVMFDRFASLTLPTSTDICAIV
jgi:hypothetical protein